MLVASDTRELQRYTLVLECGGRVLSDACALSSPSPPRLPSSSVRPVLESGGRFGRSSEAASKYIRFTEEGLDSLLNEFFQGRESRNILLTQPAAR
ncbi:unnamed protein product [Closterium sp. Naga37s-1]|nr:unnamed protein product [Closterium sp. Naga37s-1]